MKDYWDTFAYCLLPNHFHLLVQVKSQESILEAGSQHFSNIDKTFFFKLFPQLDRNVLANDPAVADLLNFQNLVNLNTKHRSLLSSSITQEDLHYKLALWAVRERFRRFLLGYSKAINVQEKRNGSLFQKIFRRELVEGEENCKGVAIYIHRNGIHHHYCSQLEAYPWSSYNTVLSKKSTMLKKNIVLDWFDGLEKFKDAHQAYVEDWKCLQKLIIEE